jgi:subtilisin family serine protease
MLAVLSGAVVLALTTPASGAMPSAVGGNGGPGRAPGETMTLITGDRVTVVDASRGVVGVLPGPGRERVSFLTRRIKGHTFVLPTDVLSLVGRGRLDRRLFDVTALAEFGYGDASRTDVPLIVQYASSARRPEARSALPMAGAAVGAEMPAIRSMAVRVPKAEVGRFWSSVARPADRSIPPAFAGGIDCIWLDGQRQIQLDQSVPQVGAPTAWAAGYTGAGVTIAVVDSGVDASHPDLAGRVIAERSFTGTPGGDDDVGHGTHVASIIAGSGTASSGAYRGVAPDAKLVNAKVCDDVTCQESAILAGLQWAAVDQRAQIVNLSMGGEDTPEIDPLEEAVNALTASYGTLFVVSAGNDGPEAYTVGSPGSADAALTVGAVTKSDELAAESSRGPRIGDNAIKPDIVAPGMDIVAAKARNATVGEPVGDAYLRLSGTSMAAPHVAGAAALLAGQHPDWSPGLLKAALMSAATELPGADVFGVGSGRLDAARTVTQRIVAEPASLGLGTQLWPHGDDQLIVRTVTYRNTGTAPATVALTADVSNGGDPAPPGLITVVPAELTMPAGGVGTATVTVDTRGDVPFGWYTGRIRATVDGAPVAPVPVAIEVEAERYSLTLRHIDGAGSPTTAYFTDLLRHDTQESYWFWSLSPTLMLRLAPATYLIGSMITTDVDTPAQRRTLLTYPLINLDRDLTIDLDARQARPVRLRVPDLAAPMAVTVGFDARLPWTDYSMHLVDRPGSTVTTRHLGAEPDEDVFVGRVEAVLGRPDPSGGFAGSPYQYNLAWYTPGRLPTGFHGTVRRTELAAVHQSFLPTVPDTTMAKLNMAYPMDNTWISPGGMYAIALEVPAKLTEYYMADSARWRQTLYQWSADYEFRQWTSTAIEYAAGRTYGTRWNGAVLGPSGQGPSAARGADYMISLVPMFSDGTPGHLGTGSYDTARTVLYRNGVRIAESDEAGYVWAEIPTEDSHYRLTADVSRAMSDVSTHISAVWTFRSGYSGGEAQLPIVTVRFSPALDEADTGPTGPFTIPVRVEGALDGVRALAVQVSYDDGATWRPAALTRSGEVWLAHVVHPARPGHVALRAQAVDGRGDTGRVTIIRAYHVR